MPTPIDDIVALTVFARVVESKSFTAAAAQLSLSKSVISTKVAQLEKKTGVKLLHRSTRQVTLTPDGASLFESCVPLLEAANEATHAVDRVGGSLAGIVRLTFPVGLSLHMPKIVESFIVKYPAIKLELSCTDRHVDLVKERFDVGIRITREITDNALSARRIGSERVILCAAPKYLERHGRPTQPQDLKQHRCLLSSLHSADWKLVSSQRSATVSVSGNLVSDNAALILQAAIEGLGVALLPMSFVKADLEAGRLARILDDYATESFSVFLVHPYERKVPGKVRVLIDHLVQQMQDSESFSMARPRSKKRAT